MAQCQRLAAMEAGRSWTSLARIRAPSDDELGAVEDCLADFFEASAGCEHMTMEMASMNRAVATALKLIALSEGMTKDTMFARQVKRKFC